jgi:hypothetical protein
VMPPGDKPMSMKRRISLRVSLKILLDTVTIGPC